MSVDLLDHFQKYKEAVNEGIASVSQDSYVQAFGLLHNKGYNWGRIFVCGNGGSAAIAEHLSCDHSKAIHLETGFRPQVISLSSNMALLTAIANDDGYRFVFSDQMRYSNFSSSDLLICISSSGNSDNIVHALKYAIGKRAETISMVGFDGGEVKQIHAESDADVNCLLHVQRFNYGVIEDCHQALMHMLSQALIRDHYKNSKVLKY